MRKINGYIDERVRHYLEFRCRGEEGWAALWELCEHADVSARFNAAAFYRYRDNDLAMEILREMGRNPNFWAPGTVRREVAYQASSLVREIDRRAAKNIPPLTDIYDSWVEDMKAVASGVAPKVKYVEAVVPYRGEYAEFNLEGVREKFLAMSERVQSVKVDDNLSGVRSCKLSHQAERELYKLYFELRERGEDGLAVLRELARTGPMTAKMQAAKFLQWTDLPLACEVLNPLGDCVYEYEDDTIEGQTCEEAYLECMVLGQVLQGTSFGTTDPYDEWKEWRALNPEAPATKKEPRKKKVIQNQ